MPLSIDLASPRLAVHRHHVCVRVCTCNGSSWFPLWIEIRSFLEKKKVELGFQLSREKRTIFLLLSIKIENGMEFFFFFFNKKLIKIIETRLKINHSDPWRKKLIIVPFELENLKMKRLDIVRGDCHRKTKGIVSVFFLRNTWRRGGRELCQPVLQPPQHIVREACRGEKKGLLNFSFS